MNRRMTKAFAALALLSAFPSFAGESACLWQIGRPDTHNAEFALAPGNYSQSA